MFCIAGSGFPNAMKDILLLIFGEPVTTTLDNGNVPSENGMKKKEFNVS
jgi:hypothetical protein